LKEAPPQLTQDDVFSIGIERNDGGLAGMVTYLRHFYERNEWYMGLLILDPAERGNKLGRRAAEHVFEHAKSDCGTVIRIAVLDANPRGRKFWESLDFTLERTVPADQNDDGKIRHVLKKLL
jgi:ribosomal protein S18 acetylase RimI-like enzyme